MRKLSPVSRQYSAKVVIDAEIEISSVALPACHCFFLFNNIISLELTDDFSEFMSLFNCDIFDFKVILLLTGLPISIKSLKELENGTTFSSFSSKILVLVYRHFVV